MVFVSVTYHAGATPLLSTVHAVLSINGKPFAEDGAAWELDRDRKLVLELNSGQTWVVYSDRPLELRRQRGGAGKGSGLVAVGPVEEPTTVRIARIPGNGGTTDLLDPYAGRVVTGGRVTVVDSHRYALEWTTVTTGGGGNGGDDCPLLQYALPHHLASLTATTVDGSTAVVVDDVTADSATRGRMVGVEGTRWELAVGDGGGNGVGYRRGDDETEFPVGFGPNKPIDPETAVELDLREHLRRDIADRDWTIPTADGGSYYFTGKQMQLYASLCLLADDRNVVPDSDGDGDDLRGDCLEKFGRMWDTFLLLDNNESNNNQTSSWAFPLVYDEVYKGIVSSEGFRKHDAGADFGNTVYNDHHYHYGYWIVSAAIFLHLRPDYPNRDLLIGRIDCLVRDAASSSSSSSSDPGPDPFFPRFRHFDWYHGHSYAHGITPMADGKDQESVSEEMNFHYGLLLWGKATNRPDIESLGALMLRVNNLSIRTYFWMSPPAPAPKNDNDNGDAKTDGESTVHPAAFRRNRVTGIAFDNKCHYTTWFSPDRWCIHGIQMIPVSPLLPYFRPRSFVADEWESVLESLDVVRAPEDHPSPWQSLLFANRAIVDPRAALKHLRFVPMDDGLSRSWALYSAATFGTVNNSNDETDTDETPSSSSSPSPTEDRPRCSVS